MADHPGKALWLKAGLPSSNKYIINTLTTGNEMSFSQEMRCKMLKFPVHISVFTFSNCITEKKSKSVTD